MSTRVTPIAETQLTNPAEADENLQSAARTQELLADQSVKLGEALALQRQSTTLMWSSIGGMVFFAIIAVAVGVVAVRKMNKMQEETMRKAGRSIGEFWEAVKNSPEIKQMGHAAASLIKDRLTSTPPPPTLPQRMGMRRRKTGKK